MISLEMGLVIGIMVAAIYLFASEKFSVDFVALLVLASVLLLGLVTPEQGLSGFSNPATVTVGAMFILSAGLQKTGAVTAVGRGLIRMGKNYSILLLLVMATIGAISAFINNTAAVAVFLPLVLSVCARRKISASKLLIPLSYASQFGGVCTLIGTSTNLLVSSISSQYGFGAFHMFEFTRMGLILLGAGSVYFLLLGRWLLPARRREQLTETYELGEYITELRVQSESPLINKTVLESRFGQLHDATVLEILRDEKKIWSPLSEPVQAGDVLLVRGRIKDLMELKDVTKLEIEPQFKLRDESLEAEDLMLVEALVAPRSRLIGRTLAELNFRRRFNAIVLAIHRREQTLREKLNQVRLRFGDAVLLQGPRDELERLRRDENFIILHEVEEPALRRTKVPLALGIIAGVIALAALGILPIILSALIGCLLMVMTRCLTLEEAYSAVDWKVIFLLGGILPLGIAMQNTGTAEFLARQSVALVGNLGPIAVLAVIYLLTATLTECMSNNASAVLLAPIAINTAQALGLDPRPFLMAVCFAASTSFATPVGYQTNTMVYNAGGYKFTDFLKVGVPLNLIFWGLATYFIPKFWSFQPLALNN
jgi:di/tricarboxylate transporter